MKLKFSVTSIGAAVTCILALVSTILFAAAYNGSGIHFPAQFHGLPYVVGFGVVTMVLSIAVILLPMLNVDGLVKKIIDITTDVLIVLICVFLILLVVNAAKSSVYEMALTWGSDFHGDEPFMKTVCSNALASMIISAVAMLIMGVSACITKTIYAKEKPVQA